VRLPDVPATVWNFAHSGFAAADSGRDDYCLSSAATEMLAGDGGRSSPCRKCTPRTRTGRAAGTPTSHVSRPTVGNEYVSDKQIGMHYQSTAESDASRAAIRRACHSGDVAVGGPPP